MYRSDDYASIECGDISFYYGYEMEYCAKHGICAEYCADTDCETEWCGYVRLFDNIVLVLTTSEIEKESDSVGKLHSTTDYLLVFMEMYLNINKRIELIKNYGIREAKERGCATRIK